MESKLHIGYVEWVKNAEYGMLYDLENQKSFFCHVNKNPLITDLRKDYYVLFETYFDKRKNQECAKDVIRLAHIEDKGLIKDLINRFEPPLENPEMNQIQGLYSGYKTSAIEKIVKQLKRQFDVIDFCSEEKLKEVQKNPRLIEEYINDNKFSLLKRDKVIEYFHDYAQENIIDLIKKKSTLLSSFNDETGAKLFDKVIYETERIDSLESYDNAVELINSSLTIGLATKQKLTNHFIKVSEPIFKLRFWLRGDHEGDIQSYLENTFMSLDDTMLNDIYRKLSSDIREELLESLIGKNLSQTQFIRSSEYNNIWKQRIELLEIEKRQKFLDEVFDKSDEVTKLSMWVHEVTEKFDFDSFKVACVTLDKNEQETFIKKVFKFAEEDKLLLGVEMLKELQLFDRQLSSELGIDYTLDIILSTIFQLSEGSKLSEKNNIIDVLAHHIEKNPFRQFNIEGYFDLCEGKSYVSVDTVEDEKVHFSIVRSNNIPSGVKFCEGRKSKDLDNNYNLPFWWCRNSKCFNPCHAEHNVSDWKNYTLRDFLRILNIQYDEESYDTFLGWVNRINTLLSRLNCRGCGKILKPNNQTNYSFYRVNSFKCDNENCNHKEIVYLNHCLNGKCKYLIDSRDSVKCENGMYICSNPECGDCCSTEVFASRIQSLKLNGQPVPSKLQYLVDNNLGHKGRISFCYKCGHSLKGGWEKYEEVKNWLISIKDNNNGVIKSGKRQKDNRWWFLTDFPNEKYKPLIKLGFQVKQNDDGRRFVSEPFGKMEDPPKYCVNENCENSKT
jgi:hypothetical protein